MSIKHGAMLGLTIAVMGMLSVLGIVSGPGADGGHGVSAATTQPGLETSYARAVSEPPTQADALADVLTTPAQEPIALPEATKVASAAAPGTIIKDLLAQSVLAQDVELLCDLIPNIAIEGNFSAVDAELPVWFYHDMRNAEDNSLSTEVTAMEWYFKQPAVVDGEEVWGDPDVYQARIDYTAFPEQARVSYTYAEDGSYDVGVRIRVGATWCPPQSDPPYVFRGLVSVGSVPAAKFETTDLLQDADTYAIVPSSNWVQLFSFNMSYGEKEYAPRALTQLRFRLRADPKAAEREYRVAGGPTEDNIRTFAIYLDADGSDDFDPDEDAEVVVWDSHGYPYEMPTLGAGNITYNGHNYVINDVEYNLNFALDPSQAAFDAANPYSNSNPKFPQEKWITAAPGDGNTYFLVFQTSSTWHAPQTLSYELLDARMDRISVQNAAVLGFPRKTDGTPVDSYSPNFYDLNAPEILAPEAGYSSSFTIQDLRGPEAPSQPASYANIWNYQQRMYTPLSEYVRPRWDKGTALMNIVQGETLDLRKLIPVEAWEPLIGIDAHGGSCIADQPREINVIFTDIGADPFGAPGNGGFDPREGLERFTSWQHDDYTVAAGEDYAFNGVWLWYDTEGGDSCKRYCPGNGVFDAPVPNGRNGATLVDFPMVPEILTEFGESSYAEEMQHYEWEYIPFPPGGGDPWWKIRLRFSGGRRRAPTDVCTGYFEVIPDPVPEAQYDYFLVMRADSGYEDISGRTGDGVGILPGADFRCFIEPRRWHPGSPATDNTPEVPAHWDGGVLLTSFDFDDLLPYPALANPYLQEKLNIDPKMIGFWQDNADANDNVCSALEYPCTGTYSSPLPWWNERMMNRDTVKPLRTTVEVHDLVMTYSTDSYYAKETPIHPAQDISRWYIGIVLSSDYLVRGTGFPDWVDPAIFVIQSGGETLPFGLLEFRFMNFNYPDITPDQSDRIFNDDHQTAVQYAFETVPFKLNGDAIDSQNMWPRSSDFRNPYEQPTLPRFSTWPMKNAPVSMGFSSYCYLADDGGNNEPFLTPTSSESTRTYEDDVYVFVVEDQTVAFGDVSGCWLVDSAGAKFRILSNSGTALTLEKGHAAYNGREYLTHPDGTISLSTYPYGIGVGQEYAVRRGHWMIVRDTLRRGTYPRMEDWSAGLAQSNGTPGPNGEARGARLLKQYIGASSQPTGMLGFNLVGTEDNNVNADAEISLQGITVAFWGPEFKVGHLAKLDATAGAFSGIQLYEDTNGSGVFEGPVLYETAMETLTVNAGQDEIIPVAPSMLEWKNKPEPVDLDGDGIADDMSGDGVVASDQGMSLITGLPLEADEVTRWDGLSDEAWVVSLNPLNPWTVPHADNDREAEAKRVASSLSDVSTVWDLNQNMSMAGWPSFWGETPAWVQATPLASLEKEAKASSAAMLANNKGDDLFVVVRTSDSIPAFSEFRCVVPATLPGGGRPDSERLAGVKMLPAAYISPGAFRKANPEEGAVQDFYGHDMMAVDVPAALVDMTEPLLPDVGLQVPVIEPGSPGFAALGIDVSANRPENTIASGEKGAALANGFQPIDIPDTVSEVYFADGAWTAETVGFWLIGESSADDLESRIEAYEITAVQGDELILRAGAPRNDSPWLIIKNPTFLEQVVVELYEANEAGGFDPMRDLLPLDYEDPAAGHTSGLALYRDNDWHPLNRNGEFDPPVRDEDGNVLEYIDLPLRLDHPPMWIGTVGGEPQNQARFVFSRPGTDDLIGLDDVPYETQARNRQWVPQTFGNAPSDADYGPDFFVVARTSRDMSKGDSFQVGLVSWGPNTPTEPDPDNFKASVAQTDDLGRVINDFDMFSEYPWGSRALGFITFFKDAPEVRYWGYDKDERKEVPRTELDHSQDQSRIGRWIRTNTPVASMTRPIVALEPPVVDFTADRNRQVAGGDVNFTLRATGTIAKVLWQFGDGLTSSEENPTHTYARAGLYTVSLTVTDRFGVQDTETKTDFIEILAEAPIADFIADPQVGNITPDPLSGKQPGLDVYFYDRSVGTDAIQPTAYFWNFGDGETSTQTPTEEEPLVHRYLAEGFYTVTLEVTFRDTTTGDTLKKTQTINNYITVLECIGCDTQNEGEGAADGEDDEAPAADFAVETLIRDKESLVPLTDWVPLCYFTMGYPAETPAPRVLRTLTYKILPDKREPKDLNYGNFGAPNPSDILEFGLFKETPADDEGGDGDEDARNHVLDSVYDDLLYTWDSLGTPLGRIISQSTMGGMTYTLDFIGAGTPDDPEFPVEAEPVDDDDKLGGASYILAVRTSAVWRSMLTMGCHVLNAEMILPTTGEYPVKDEDEPDAEPTPVDSYSVDFRNGEAFEPEAAYSSSFTAWDISSAPGDEKRPTFFNTWNHPPQLYTPIAEQTRPRWNKLDDLLEMTAGELLEIRKLLSLDSWTDMIGLNIQSTKSVHFDATGRDISSKDAAQLREVNLILTDIGADPFGAPGNGGFNPNDALKRVTTHVGVTFLAMETASKEDITFNGAWVWHDTNNNGVFDAPTPNENEGVTFNGDFPLFPDDFRTTDANLDLISGDILQWEYIALPPGGGDPWWKLKMNFWGGRRRRDIDEDDVEGYLETTPDNAASDAYSGSEYTSDYFVVVRTDSGFQDISMTSPSGTGATMGADFRAFIEPRRTDSKGNQVGGVYVDSMIPHPSSGDTYWQDEVYWGSEEPWWPERTINAKASKPARIGLDVHDLVLVYESESAHSYETDIFFGDGPNSDAGCLGFVMGFGDPTDFEYWMDPFDLQRARFYNGHTVGVLRYRYFGSISINLIGDSVVRFAYDETNSRGQFAFETTPFHNNEAPEEDGRSAAYPNPPAQPFLPWYSTWPKENNPYEYPRLSDWPADAVQARLLTQKVDIDSSHTAMLGINAVTSTDPIVQAGREAPSLAVMYVAFWGPDFTPSDLKPLDAEGKRYDSGVLLWQDADNNGTFFEAKPFEDYTDLPITGAGFDELVPLRNLTWPTESELVDLDGDGQADDMNGDGVVDDADKAWVLAFYPEFQWEIPTSDPGVWMYAIDDYECGSIDFDKQASTKVSGVARLETQLSAGSDAKQEDDLLSEENAGDDLFVTVCTSDSMQRFESFRAVVPATLPTRSEGARKAGIQFFPQVNTSASAYIKSSPDEDAVQDFYGHDMLQVNVPMKILNLGNQLETVYIGGAPRALLGLDISTNRETAGTLASGESGEGSAKTFVVQGQTWTEDAFIGEWLVDEGYETYEIVGNDADSLTLRSGTPRSGQWRIVTEPTFLEQVTVELYNEGTDADFNPLLDLLPLSQDQAVSGVALYRDNDAHPDNRNGQFDPTVDIPLPLDAAPVYTGQTGENTQVRFVFSSPGTDDLPVPLEEQERNRQWVPDTFGTTASHSFAGADFFVVVRVSNNMQDGDNFRIGLVNWGPNTPTAPDPDTWARLSGEERNGFAKFEEFPWAEHGVGFITYFKDAPVSYFMDGAQAGRRTDNSGFNWLRSASTQKRRSSVVTARPKPVTPTSVVVSSASQTELPSQVLPESPFTVVLRGENFGTAPEVILSGYAVEITQATDTAINLSLTTDGAAAPVEPVVLIVRNTETKEEAVRSDLFTLKSGTAEEKPEISGVTPGKGSKDMFPVTVEGTGFAAREEVQVLFGGTLMPVLAVNESGTSITVGFPTGGIPGSGALDVTVRNTAKSTEDILVAGFEYENAAIRPGKRVSFLGCSSETDAGRPGIVGDGLVLLFVLGALYIAARRKLGQAIQ